MRDLASVVTAALGPVRIAHLGERGRVAYRLSPPRGDRLPVMLHRPLGGTMDWWSDFALELAHSFQVIAFDPRGVGRSGDPPCWITTHAMARDARALLVHLQLARAHLFGLSLGAMVATRMAVDAPSAVGALVLASMVPQPRALSHRFARRIPGLVEHLATPATLAEPELVRQVLSTEFCKAYPERARAWIDAARVTGTRPVNLLRLLTAAAIHAPLPALARLHLPVLLVYGTRDPIAGRASHDELRHELPDAEMAELGAGHDLSLEAPHELAARVVAFLCAHEGAYGLRTTP